MQETTEPKLVLLSQQELFSKAVVLWTVLLLPKSDFFCGIISNLL